MAADNPKSLQTIVAGERRDLMQCRLQSIFVQETKALVSELCRHFYTLGWVSGTGGSVAIKVRDDNVPKSDQLIVMSPSGVQKERMAPEDMYALSSDGLILSRPLPKSYPYKAPKCTDSADLFLKIFDMCNAGAVIHSHAMESCIVTTINERPKEFRIAGMEMIKGIDGHGLQDELVIPIIENASNERELVKPLADAIRAYSKTTAVLVRGHGVFMWGDSWITAKTQAECYHYLFAAALKLHQLGMDRNIPCNGSNNKGRETCSCHKHSSRVLQPRLPSPCNDSELMPRYIFLDLEATTAALHLLTDATSSYRTIDEQILAASVTSKGHNWKNTYQRNELVGNLYDDVPEALQQWHASGIKVYLCSSRSRVTQNLLFGHSNHGDLREYLCGYFDTTMGNKTKGQVYYETLLTIGAAKPSDILFLATDLEEALFARSAGLQVIVLVRPGSKFVGENHGVRAVESLLEVR